MIKEEIHELRDNGTSIILSTHRMEQVEEICEYLVMIHQGKNVLDGSVKDVKERFKEHKFRICYEGDLPEGMTFGNVQPLVSEPGEVIIQVEEDKDSNNFLERLIRAGVFIRSFEEILPTINEIFIQVVGEEPAAQ